MFGFYEKRKIKRIIYSKGFFGVLAMLCLCMSYAAYGAYGKMQGTIERRAELSEELAELEQHATALEADIEHLHDSRGVESELRSRYEVGLEGEEVIVLVEDEEEEEVSSGDQEQEKSFLGKIFDIF